MICFLALLSQVLEYFSTHVYVVTATIIIYNSFLYVKYIVEATSPEEFEARDTCRSFTTIPYCMGSQVVCIVYVTNVTTTVLHVIFKSLFINLIK